MAEKSKTAKDDDKDKAKQATQRREKVTSADQLKSRDEPDLVADKSGDEPEDEPVKEPSSKVDEAVLKRVAEANAKIVQKGETTERIEVAWQDGQPVFWWVNYVRLRKVGQEDDEWLLGKPRPTHKESRAQEQLTSAQRAIDRDEADGANRASKAAAEEEGRRRTQR